MAHFLFKLAPLLQYRRHRRDLCRQMFAEILSDERRLILERARLDHSRTAQLEEIKHLNSRGRVDIDRASARRYHASQLQAQTRVVERNRELIQQQIDLCRRALILSDRDVKVLERLEEKQRAEFLKRSLRREQFDLEEAWQASNRAEAS